MPTAAASQQAGSKESGALWGGQEGSLEDRLKNLATGEPSGQGAACITGSSASCRMNEITNGKESKPERKAESS